MVLAHCILGKFLGVCCHCFTPPLDIPTFSARCLHVRRRERTLTVEGATLRGREMFRQISSRIRLPPNSRCRKSATWDRRFYFPSEGRRVEGISPLKIRRLRTGFNPRTWVPKDSTLPLDHRSRYICIYYINIENNIYLVQVS
jgi:hypothetical protein